MLIVDIRPREDYAKRPSNALNIPEHALKDSLDLFHVHKEIHFICPTGLNAQRIAYRFQKMNLITSYGKI